MNTSKSQTNITGALTALQNQLYDISARNPFMDVKLEKLWFTDNSTSKHNVKRIFERQTFFLKEYGLETTLRIGLFIKWKLPNKDVFYTSPLLYQPAVIKRRRRIETEYELVYDKETNWLVNPILLNLFKIHFDFTFESSYPTHESLISKLTAYFNTDNQIVTVQDVFDDKKEWQCIQQQAVGTFNYKKSVLAKDFETIIETPNDCIKQLLGFSGNQSNAPVPGLLDWFPLDLSQREVVSKASSNNIVIQGPPGTGKSHTIVALLTHFLYQGKKVLFVSEKKSALDVVYQRMGALKSLAAYFDAEKQTKLSYYKSLKKSFEKARLLVEEEKLNIDNSLLQKSRVYPEESQKADIVSGISIAKLESDLVSNDVEDHDFHPQSQIPDFLTWKAHASTLVDFEKNVHSEWKKNAIGETTFLGLNKVVFNERQPVPKIDAKIESLLKYLLIIEEIQLKFNLDLKWEDFSKTCLSASILNMVNRSQIDLLFPTTKAYKSFNNWTKKYELTQHKLKNTLAENTLWHRKPAIDKIRAYELLQKSRKRFFNFKYKRYHQEIFKDYAQTVPYEKATEVLTSLKLEYELVQQLDELKIKLKHNLNIMNPDTEIDFILNIRNKVDSVSHNFYQLILERNDHLELISVLSEQHQNIANINRLRNYLFSGKPPEEIKAFQLYLNHIRSELKHIKLFTSEVRSILDLPLNIIDFLKLNPYRINVLHKMITRYHLQQAVKYQDYLKTLSGKKLLDDLNGFNTKKTKTYQKIINAIYTSELKNWRNTEALCDTPNSKLSPSEKLKKAHYKKARRLMIHEMNKSRQLMPVKDLFDNCQPLLNILHPIWMMNPLAIAERLPLSNDIFDVVIFDESSQIPLEDALPAVYRAKQMIVVGDSQQMPPSRFFSANTNSITLLSEAQKYLESVSLKWHYRSNHPNLIKFSNYQFYDNELRLFPSYNNYRAVRYHYVREGVFDNHVNVEEAKVLAKRYNELILQGETDIAIIGLSKEQEKCIRSAITNLGTTIPDTVEIRNLDSVQGIEKKYVLISIGYAKRLDGRLNLNFGPINQEFGANRLNVLFSRAIKQMEVFTSLIYKDIGSVENKGLNILSQFLRFANQHGENNQPEINDVLAIKLDSFLKSIHVSTEYVSEHDGIVISGFINYEKQKILLINPGLYTTETIDLPTILLVLKQRFKSVKIIINNDWISDPESVKNDLRNYFL